MTAVNKSLMDADRSAFSDYAGEVVRNVKILNTGADPIPVDIQDASVTVTESVPDTAYVTQSITVTTSQVALPTTALANRKLIIIENKSGANIFYGPTGVTTTTGIRLPNNSVVSLAIGPSITMYALRSAGSGDVTVQEVA